jgi:Flp pilus assembly pilin Flp
MLTRLYVKSENRLRGLRARRGAGFLEYALVALISVALFTLLLTLFRDQLSGIMKRLGDSINGTK